MTTSARTMLNVAFSLGLVLSMSACPEDSDPAGDAGTHGDADAQPDTGSDADIDPDFVCQSLDDEQRCDSYCKGQGEVMGYCGPACTCSSYGPPTCNYVCIGTCQGRGYAGGNCQSSQSCFCVDECVGDESCSQDQVCSEGACEEAGFMVGEPCGEPGDCTRLENAQCLSEVDGFAGGYCSAACDPDEGGSACPSGSFCRAVGDGADIGRCEKECSETEPDACREGYNCEPIDEHSSTCVAS